MYKLVKIIRRIIPVLLILIFHSAGAQQVRLTLKELQSLALKNYPLTRSSSLVNESGAAAVKNAGTAWLPSVNINGQYTYQSDVTSIPVNIPNLSIPVIDQNQYKVYADVNQVLYDGGAIRNQKHLAESISRVESETVEVELYKITERVNQLYFGVLLSDGLIRQTSLFSEDIKAGLSKMEAAYRNGAVLKSSVDALKVEMLKADQRITELEANRKAQIKILSAFTGMEIPDDALFEMPATITPTDSIKRPELGLFDARINSLLVQDKALTSRNLPRLQAFLQGGYGKPGLNMLNPDADTYYITGLRMTLPVSGFYTLKRERSINRLNRQTMDIQKETFLFNTNLQLTQYRIEVDKWRTLLSSDKEITALRELVKQSALSQLENGVITAADYVRDVNAANNARQTEYIHSIQLLMALYSYNQVSGNQ